MAVFSTSSHHRSKAMAPDLSLPNLDRHQDTFKFHDNQHTFSQSTSSSNITFNSTNETQSIQQKEGSTSDLTPEQVSYTTQLISNLLSVSQQEVLTRAGTQDLINTYLDSITTLTPSDSTTQQEASITTTHELVTDSPPTSQPQSEMSSPHPITPSVITTTNLQQPRPRTLKTCLRLRDTTKILPIRTLGCKGSKRSDGDETPRSVSWGCPSLSSSSSPSANSSRTSSPLLHSVVRSRSVSPNVGFNGSGNGSECGSECGCACGSACLTPLEEVFWVERVEWSVGWEYDFDGEDEEARISGIPRCGTGKGEIVDEEEEMDETKSALAARIERRLSL